jgi:Spy/CpxP family protein refolding chaperone
VTAPLQPPRRARLLGAALLAATLVAGGLTGAAIDRAVVRHALAAPGGGPCRDARRRPGLGFLEPLHLTAAQRDSVKAILEHRRGQMDAFWAEAGPRLRAVVDATETEIRSVLTPEQRATFDRMRAARDARHRERWRRDWTLPQGHGGPPPAEPPPGGPPPAGPPLSEPPPDSLSR